MKSAKPKVLHGIGGRSMLGHYGGPILDAQGRWLNQVERVNSSADISPTAGQMPRLVGLAYASRLYRELPELARLTTFSKSGNEVAFGIIGNASCAEGLFWEAINAIGVLRAPAVISIWDDGYGISVPNREQVMEGNLTALLQGFKRSSPDAPIGLDDSTPPEQLIGIEPPISVDPSSTSFHPSPTSAR